LTVAYIGLGSNLGDRAASLASARDALDWGAVRIVAASSVYETAPVGGPAGQPSFLNQVLAVETDLDADELFDRCMEVEAAHGRARDHEEHWGPRTIDVDLLLFGDDVRTSEHLVLPHPRLHERAFVAVPLAEIAPDVVIPGFGRAQDVARALDHAGVSVL